MIRTGVAKSDEKQNQLREIFEVRTIYRKEEKHNRFSENRGKSTETVAHFSGHRVTRLVIHAVEGKKEREITPATRCRVRPVSHVPERRWSVTILLNPAIHTWPTTQYNRM